MQIFSNEHHPLSFINLIEDGIERKSLSSLKVVVMPNSLTIKYYTMPDEDAVIKITFPHPTVKVKIALGSREEIEEVLDNIFKAVLEVADSLTV